MLAALNHANLPSQMAALATRGPRYTSYPPATQFASAFGEDDARQHLEALRPLARERGVSLYLHVPFCTSLCWYCGCNVKITRDRSRGHGYVDTLIREIGLYRELLGEVSLAELSLGGGSPNFLPADELARLTSAALEAFPARDDALLGIELDPRDTSEAQLVALAAAGFRRLSVGVQDFDPKVQEVIHRSQSALSTGELIARARELGFASVGVDLIYGLPGQTPASIHQTLDAVIEMSPDRLALFGYAHLPHLRKHQKLVERAPIPDVPARAELLCAAIDVLCAAGYERVGFDHFARPHDPLARAARDGILHRNFQGFTVMRGGPLVACGVTAISDVTTAYWQNLTDIDAWTGLVESGHLPVARGVALSDDDRIRRHVIFRLMCDGAVSMSAIGDELHIDFGEYFGTELERLGSFEMAPLVSVDVDAIRLTSLGFELVRNVCMVFDRYIREAPPEGSTTI